MWRLGCPRRKQRLIRRTGPGTRGRTRGHARQGLETPRIGTAGLAAPGLPLAALSSSPIAPLWTPPPPCQGLPGSPLPDPAPPSARPLINLSADALPGFLAYAGRMVPVVTNGAVPTESEEVPQSALLRRISRTACGVIAVLVTVAAVSGMIGKSPLVIGTGAVAIAVSVAG